MGHNIGKMFPGKVWIISLGSWNANFQDCPRSFCFMPFIFSKSKSFRLSITKNKTKLELCSWMEWWQLFSIQTFKSYDNEVKLNCRFLAATIYCIFEEFYLARGFTKSISLWSCLIERKLSWRHSTRRLKQNLGFWQNSNESE